MLAESLSPAFFFIFGGLFFLLALIRILEYNYISELTKALWNPGLTQLLQQEGKLGLHPVQFMADIVATGSYSFLLMLCLDESTITAYKHLFLIVTCFYAGHLMVVRLFSYIFFGDATAGAHESEIILFNRVTGIFLLPAVIILTYGNIMWSDHILSMVVILLIIVFIWRFTRIFSLIRTRGHHGSFYIFLYLCALEISPFILLIKAVISS